MITKGKRNGYVFRDSEHALLCCFFCCSPAHGARTSQVSPQNSQISIRSTEMWGSLGQLTGDKNTGCGAVVKPLPPCSLSFDMRLLSPYTHCRVPLWPLLSSLLSTPTLPVHFDAIPPALPQYWITQKSKWHPRCSYSDIKSTP